ncbi:GIY-YIG nuclease family protein [Parapedobacter tibetensis]|uniref:GIY-YIG nuclease family protein n=1 Tax=Parapedobacter tibetensis TaxID=2972951 RepID=UPI00356B628F
MFTVYVLFSQKHNKIYIGYTSNIEERFKPFEREEKEKCLHPPRTRYPVMQPCCNAVGASPEILSISLFNYF